MIFFAECGVFLAIVAASGLLAMVEVALLSARPARLEQLAAAKNAAVTAALELNAKPERFLPAVKTGIAFCTTLASIFAGVAFVDSLSGRLASAGPPWLAAQSQVIAFATVVVAVAIVLLVLAEMVPQRIALRHAEAIAAKVARPTQAACRLLRPVVGLAEAVTTLLVGVDRAPRDARQGSADQTVSIEDIEHLLRTGARQGVLDPSEQMVARRALRLGDRTVREIMRPRIEIDALDVDTPPDEVIGAVAMAGFSRVPVHEGDLDHIIGFVYTKDLLLRQHMGWPIELRKLVRPALLVPQSLRIDRLLARFREKRTQMALVLDEFGGTQGLVTMEDVLEELVGEIHDEHRSDREQRIVPRVVEGDAPSWHVDAGLPLRDLLQYLDEELPTEVPIEASTVGGLVMFVLGRIPEPGDIAHWRQLSLEVDAMEGRRIERLLVRRTV